MTQGQVGEHFGLKQQSVGDWEKGRSLPQAERIGRLMQILPELRKEPVFYDYDPSLEFEQPLSVRDQSPSYARRGVPIVGTVRAGPERHYLELEYPTGHGDGTVGYNSKDQSAYAVRVEGDSMLPRIRPGEFVIAEPAKNYRPGDEVLVTTRSGQKMVKQFLYERDGLVALDSVNATYDRIVVPREEIESLHYIVAITKSDSRDPD